MKTKTQKRKDIEISEITNTQAVEIVFDLFIMYDYTWASRTNIENWFGKTKKTTDALKYLVQNGIMIAKSVRSSSGYGWKESV